MMRGLWMLRTEPQQADTVDDNCVETGLAPVGAMLRSSSRPSNSQRSHPPTVANLTPLGDVSWVGRFSHSATKQSIPRYMQDATLLNHNALDIASQFYNVRDHGWERIPGQLVCCTGLNSTQPCQLVRVSC